MALISLLTDFGLGDPFVGEMKAVILGIAPDAAIVDLTHGIAPGGVREAGWVLSRAWSSFPDGTCHVAVVDPGVGSDRRALAAMAGGHVFVGPDNGLLSTAIAAAAAARPGDGPPEVREITVREIDRPRRGSTFDGRDLFAPVAARLVAGAPLAELGPEVHDAVPGESFAPRADGNAWESEVVRIDHYGNLVTPVEECFLRESFGDDWRGIRVVVGETELEGVRIAYADVEPGGLLLSIGGGGTLEISANRASARKVLGLAPGDRIRLAGPGSSDGVPRPKRTGEAGTGEDQECQD